ncbi:MFS transporter [Streptomyces sp. NPDC056161]|uniref:MFS transporter n=1 Tax=Streptomyces sp. NPDC056161 TaxID=3345732 RepID=UPI0035E1BC21
MSPVAGRAKTPGRRPSKAPRRAVAAAVFGASLPVFMVSLNNLLVTNALPEIEKQLLMSITGLQWVINAYILAFAGLLLTGSALGDRFGRRKVFLAGIALFAVGSALCGMVRSGEVLIAARTLQGAGAAAIQPLSLTLVVGAVPAAKRSVAIGLWGGVNGLGVALGPLVGGLITAHAPWQWIFWVNIPVAAAAVPFVLRGVRETHGEDSGLDLPGMVMVIGAVTLAVWGIVQVGTAGWSSPSVLVPLAAAVVLTTAFVSWERRARSPLLPLHFYRQRAFVMSNLVSLAFYFGVFGSIFFLSQYFQDSLGYSALGAGVRTLPWSAMPMLVAPIAGAFTDRVGGNRLMAGGLALQGLGLAWVAAIAQVGLSYTRLVPALVLAGVGMGLVFAPTMAVVLGSVRPHDYSKASGANNTVREIGGALGVAALSTVYLAHFTVVRAFPFDAARAFVHGMVAALWVGVAVLLAAAVLSLFIPASPALADEDGESGMNALVPAESPGTEGRLAPASAD